MSEYFENDSLDIVIRLMRLSANFDVEYYAFEDLLNSSKIMVKAFLHIDSQRCSHQHEESILYHLMSPSKNVFSISSYRCKQQQYYFYILFVLNSK